MPILSDSPRFIFHIFFSSVLLLFNPVSSQQTVQKLVHRALFTRVNIPSLFTDISDQMSSESDRFQHEEMKKSYSHWDTRHPCATFVRQQPFSGGWASCIRACDIINAKRFELLNLIVCSSFSVEQCLITRRAVRQRVKGWSMCLNYSLLELQWKTKSLERLWKTFLPHPLLFKYWDVA